jgi:cholesterol transport system auxiliary component
MTMRALHAALAIAVAAGLAACSFTRPPVERATYDLAPARGAAPAAPAAPAKSVTLKVKPFRTAPPYDGREFLYRKADGQLVADFYNGFAAGPGELVTTAATDWLKASGLFGAVLEPGISADAAYALEGTVLAVYGDLRDGKRPAAVLDVQVYLVRAGADGRELVLDRRFSERADLADAAPEALAKGYNEALARILGRLERDLGALALKR